MVKHPLWLKVFKRLRPSYRLPSRRKLSTSQVDKEYAAVERNVNDMLNESKNLNLQLDGWSNIRNEGILNFLVTTPKPVFVKFVNTKDNRHTGEYLANEIEKVLTQYNAEKFFVLIGDNAANIQKAFSITQERYPHIIPLGCMAHTLHLLCGDILKAESVVKFMNQTMNIIKSIRSSQILSVILEKIKKEKDCHTSLQLPSKTRWGSHLHCLNSMLICKSALQCLAVNEAATEILGKAAKQTLLDDGLFWVKVTKLHNLLKPICQWIVQLETDEPIIHKAYEAFTDVGQCLNVELPSSLLTKAEEKKILHSFNERKTKSLKAVHYAADILNPASQGHRLTEEEIIDGTEFIDSIASRMQHIDDGQVMVDLAGYRSKGSGMWAKPFLWKSVDKLSPLTWWSGMCGSSQLCQVATKILSAPITSAATERSFSCFSWIHSKKRNRLTSNRAGKLTYISHNWKLLQDRETEQVSEDQCSSTSVSKKPRLDEGARNDSDVETETTESDDEEEIANLCEDDSSECESEENDAEVETDGIMA